MKNEKHRPEKKPSFFKAERTASREASREAARLLKRAVTKNDQERIHDKASVVLKRSRYYVPPVPKSSKTNSQKDLHAGVF
jgi:hypothetical protein